MTTEALPRKRRANADEISVIAVPRVLHARLKAHADKRGMKLQAFTAQVITAGLRTANAN